MADEPENHTIRLLRELRDEKRVEFAMIRRRFEQVDQQFQKVDERFDDIGLRIDGPAYMLMLQAGRSHDPRGTDRAARGRQGLAGSGLVAAGHP